MWYTEYWHLFENDCLRMQSECMFNLLYYLQILAAENLKMAKLQGE